MDRYRDVGDDHSAAVDSDDASSAYHAAVSRALAAEAAGGDAHDDDLPRPVGHDERRMQVRAYNFWASLLGNRAMPALADMAGRETPDFADNAVLLRFDGDVTNPCVDWVGKALLDEAQAPGPIVTLADVPGRSLLSRITDHYMQILANHAPIGFEAEFTNQRGTTSLYRGILLPLSADGETIEAIYGVINWKEVADRQTTEALIDEIGAALDRVQRRPRLPLTDWADGPLSDANVTDEIPVDDVLDLGSFEETPDEGAEVPLAEWLEQARRFAEAARSADERSRTALYAAIGRAWDFAIAAEAAPTDYAALVAQAGLTMQERAPLTPLLKLVFGADYDKTRLTEFATALQHARRIGLARGELARFLADAAGGLKGVVAAERKLRHAEAGARIHKPRRAAYAAKLRALPERPIEALSFEGEEFALVMIRRGPDGHLGLIGEVTGEPGLVEKAAQALLK